MKNKHLRTVSASAAFLFLLVFGNAAPAADRWDPQRTWVFFVGLVEWKDPGEFESFPADIRKDGTLLDSIRRHGVPADHISFLQDSRATTATVERRFADFLKRTQPGDWLIVYFEGHGYKDDDDTPYLATYDVAGRIKGWRFTAVPAAIEKNFRGSHAIIALDNCYSGAMVEAVKRTRRNVAYAVFASSLASQESTQNWTFTEALVNGFNGEGFVDADHDGRISLREMGQNAEQDMLFGEQQVARTSFIGGFDADTTVADAKPLSSPRIGERVEAYSEKEWYRGYIADVRGSRFKIHYYGFETEDEEWLTARSIRTPVTRSAFKIGEKVEVEYRRKWYPAHILNIRGGSHYVSYDEYDVDENEWVPTARIRKIKQATALAGRSSSRP